MPTNIEVIWQIVLVLCGGLFSGVVITSALFYRQIKREKTVTADKIVANTGLTVAETEEVRAKTDILTVTALGDAIDLLGRENKRLAIRQDELQGELSELRSEVRSALIDNELLAGQLEKLRVILLDFQKGILILTRQVVNAQLEPAYTIPNHVSALLKTEIPKIKGRGDSGG